MSYFPLAIWVWIRKLTRSRIHYYCQLYKPVTLGHWKMRLTALAIWVTFRYHVLDGVILSFHCSKFQVARKKEISLKFQSWTNVSYLPPLLQEHQMPGCKISMRTWDNLIQIQNCCKNKTKTTVPVIRPEGMRRGQGGGGGNCWRLHDHPLMIPSAPLHYFLCGLTVRTTPVKETDWVQAKTKCFWFLVQC